MFKNHLIFHIFYIVAAPLFPIFQFLSRKAECALIGRLDQLSTSSSMFWKCYAPNHNCGWIWGKNSVSWT